MKFKCKLKDLCDDFKQLGVTEITMCDSGVGYAVADYLMEKGIEVEEEAINKQF